MLTKYNLDHLIKVDLYDKYKSKRFYYQRETKTKFLWWTIDSSTDGYVDGYTYDDVMYTKSEFIDKFSDKYQIIDNVVYEKPEVELTFSNKIVVNKYFDNYDDAKNYVLNDEWLIDLEWINNPK